MYQSMLYTERLNISGTTNTSTLESNDTGYTYQFHTLIVLASNNDLVNVTVNGIGLELPGGFVLNQLPSISSVTVNSATVANKTGGDFTLITGSTANPGQVTNLPGVLLVGKRTKKQIFGN